MQTEFEIKNIPNTKEYCNKVVKFLVNFFVPDAPLWSSLEMIKNENITQILDPLVCALLDNGMAFMAVSKTGDIMGVIMNSVMQRDENVKTGGDDINAAGNSKFREIQTFLEKLKRDANVFARYPNVDRILKIVYAAVNDAYRDQKVCEKLFDKTCRKLAKERKCQMIYAECSSHFSSKAAKSCGFQCVHSIAYTDYVNENGEIVFKTHFPHTHTNVYVLPL